jgi:ribosomal protein S18 acetylase RimI-like enzyme
VRTRPLDNVPARDLRVLLRDECEHWTSELLWDYAEVSSAVLAGIERRTLGGCVADDAGRPVAYCYFMRDAGRAVVGSLYAAPDYRGRNVEEELLDHVLREAQGRRGHDRIECQTLFTTAQSADAAFGRAGFASAGREYMLRPLSRPIEPVESPLRLRPVRREDLPMVADIVHRSHRGTLDAALNLTYATASLCRSFVDTLVLRAGCGRFDPEASAIAENGRGPVGVLLASHLSATNGHVCQVSVLPEMQGSGTGRFLLASAMLSFRRQGLAVSSLSVTVGNARAHRLYEQMGYVVRRGFAAHAWARPPARIEMPREAAS